MRKFVGLLGVLFLVSLFLIPDAKAQTERRIGPDGLTYYVPVGLSDASMPTGPDLESEAFGTTYGTYFFPSVAFQPLNSTVTLAHYGGFYRYRTGGTDSFVYADFDVPSGGVISYIRLYYYDNDGAYAPDLWICRAWVDGSFGTNPGSDCPYHVTGSSAGTPGYSTIAINTPFTVNHYDSAANRDYAYYVVVGLPTTNSNIRFLGVRTIWYRQLSPAPATATFGDVPTTHPFFQYIEALVASGITAGCGGGNYCPDAPLTRGQMAVFLGRALGLHWPW